MGVSVGGAIWRKENICTQDNVAMEHETAVMRGESENFEEEPQNCR